VKDDKADLAAAKKTYDKTVKDYALAKKRAGIKA